MNRYFKAVVAGQYYALGSITGTSSVKSYEVEFTLPSQEAALSVICKHLLTPALTKKYPDFIRFRTHQLISLTLFGHKPNPEVLQMSFDEMSLDQLFDFTVLKQIMVDPFKQKGTLAEVREKISSAYQIKRSSIKLEVTETELASNKEIESLLEINKLPKKSDGLKINVNEQIAVSTTKKSKMTSTPIVESIPTDDEPLPPIVNDEPKADIFA